MSRCLAFSPEAFANRRSNREALIKKEKEEIKAEKRRLRELKKTAKEESKHKDKNRRNYAVSSDGNVTKPKVNKGCYQETRNEAELSARYLSKSVIDESDQLEKSDVTVEHDPPTCSGSVSILPDSVDSTSKRKRQEGLVKGTENRKITFRIRLPLKKHSEPNTSSTQPSERPVACPQERLEQQHNCATNTQTNVELDRPSPKPHLDLPEQTKASDTKVISARSDKSQHGKKSMYKMLIEDWVPPSLHGLEATSFDDVDEDWLFGSRTQKRHQESKRHKADHPEVSCSSSTVLWPRAKYFSDADIYALPYTVPF